MITLHFFDTFPCYAYNTDLSKYSQISLDGIFLVTRFDKSYWLLVLWLVVQCLDILCQRYEMVQEVTIVNHKFEIIVEPSKSSLPPFLKLTLVVLMMKCCLSKAVVFPGLRRQIYNISTYVKRGREFFVHLLTRKIAYLTICDDIYVVDTASFL